MDKKIGDKVSVNNKSFTISGFHKRSYLLTDDSGKIYKCGPDKLDRMENNTPPKTSDKTALRYFERTIAFAKILRRDVSMPGPENVMDWIDRIYGELSPENLTHDGELSAGVVIKRRRELQAALAYCEKMVGRKVDESEFRR